MKARKRELLTVLFIGAGASLIHAAYEAANAKFDLIAWALIVMGIAVVLGGYVVFEFMATAEEHATKWEKSTREREEQWLKRVGTPARLETYGEGGSYHATLTALLKSLKSGSDVTIMVYFPKLQQGALADNWWKNFGELFEEFLRSLLELTDAGTIRDYKRILCFDPDIFSKNPELRSGVLRVSELVPRFMHEHLRLMAARKRCSLFVAPASFQATIVLFGAEKAMMSIRRLEPLTGLLREAGAFVFCDPPNGEIIEELRRIVRETEKRMVAIHTIENAQTPVVAVPA